MQRVLEIMKGREVHEAVAALPGYIAANTGAVSTAKIISGEDGRKSQSQSLFSLAESVMPADGISLPFTISGDVGASRLGRAALS